MMAAYSRLKDLVRRLKFLASSWNPPSELLRLENCGHGTGFISYHFPLHTPRAPATQTTLIKELTHRSLDGLSTSCAVCLQDPFFSLCTFSSPAFKSQLRNSWPSELLLVAPD